MEHRLTVALLLSLISLQVQSEDVARDVVQSSQQNSVYAEIGLGFRANYNPLVGFDSDDVNKAANTTYELDLVLDGRIQYKRFFAEIIDASLSEATVGFSVYDNDRASLELIATNYFSNFERNEKEGFETIEDRHGDVSLGIRSSHFFNNSLVQLELVSDVAEHNGVVGAIHVGHQKQISNWSLYGLAGVRYFSEDAVDHVFGVSANEATESLPVYKAGAAAVVSLQLGATLPLTEKWIFSAKAAYGNFSNAIAESPLGRGDETYIRFGLNYVLFN